MAGTVVADTAEAEVVEDTAVAEAQVTAAVEVLAVEALQRRVVAVVPVQVEAEEVTEW